MTTTTRGQRHLDSIRREAIHDQRRREWTGAHRTLDQLLNEQDRLERIPWHSRPEGRAGQLVVQIRDTRQRIRELEVTREVERMFGLEPVPAAAPEPVSRRGFPPAWKL